MQTRCPVLYNMRLNVKGTRIQRRISKHCTPTSDPKGRWNSDITDFGALVNC